MRTVKVLLLLLIVLLFPSCEPITLIDESLLVGTWQNETYYECYYSDGTGKFWDESEDYYEDEAIPFTWDLTFTTLTQYHETEFGAVIPKSYTISELTESTFVYSDTFGVTHSFVKVY